MPSWPIPNVAAIYARRLGPGSARHQHRASSIPTCSTRPASSATASTAAQSPRYEVGIIDSGVDNQHNAFTGRIVAQACFVDDIAPASTNCPNAFADRRRRRRQLHALVRLRPRHPRRWHRRRHALRRRARRCRPRRRDRRHRRRIGQPDQHPLDGDVQRHQPGAAAHPQPEERGTRPNIVAINMSIGTAATFADGATCDNVSITTTNLMQTLRNDRRRSGRRRWQQQQHHADELPRLRLHGAGDRRHQ